MPVAAFHKAGLRLRHGAVRVKHEYHPSTPRACWRTACASREMYAISPYARSICVIAKPALSFQRNKGAGLGAIGTCLDTAAGACAKREPAFRFPIEVARVVHGLFESPVQRPLRAAPRRCRPAAAAARSARRRRRADCPTTADRPRSSPIAPEVAPFHKGTVVPRVPRLAARRVHGGAEAANRAHTCCTRRPGDPCCAGASERRRQATARAAGAANMVNMKLGLKRARSTFVASESTTSKTCRCNPASSTAGVPKRRRRRVKQRMHPFDAHLLGATPRLSVVRLVARELVYLVPLGAGASRMSPYRSAAFTNAANHPVPVMLGARAALCARAIGVAIAASAAAVRSRGTGWQPDASARPSALSAPCVSGRSPVASCSWQVRRCCSLWPAPSGRGHRRAAAACPFRWRPCWAATSGW